MTMSTWVIISWVVVAILTTINIIVFLKLKKASMQMMKAAFPGAKNMQEAVGMMQGMMKAARRGRKGGFRSGFPAGAMPGMGGSQMKSAMEMMNQFKAGSDGKKKK